MWKSIYSLFLLFSVTWSVWAQEPADSIEQKKKSDWKTNQWVVQLNLLRPFESMLNDEKSSAEVRGLWIKNRWLFMGEFGYAETMRGDTSTYQSEGLFGRAGFAYNLVKNPSTQNVVALGLNYGRTVFDDEAVSTLQQGTLEVPFVVGNSGGSAGWIEMTGHLMLTIRKRWVMGYTIRYQIFRRLNRSSRLDPFDLPGYGKVLRDNSFSFDYYLGWKLVK